MNLSEVLIYFYEINFRNGIRNKMDFSDFVVRKCAPTAMYIPNFITLEEEQRLLKQIEKTPKPKWTQLMNRRLINYGGIPHPNGMLAEQIPDWLQVYIDKINNFNIFDQQKANHVLINEYKPGQGIMPHTDGPLFHPIISTISIGSHTVLEFIKRDQRHEDLMMDDEHIEKIDSKEKTEESSDDESQQTQVHKREVICKLLLEPRSLLVLKDNLYSDYMHLISEVERDVLCDRIYNYENCENVYKMGDTLTRSTRVSLTIRNVPKTTRMKLKFC